MLILVSAPFGFLRAFHFSFSDHILNALGRLWTWSRFGHARLIAVFAALILGAL